MKTLLFIALTIVGCGYEVPQSTEISLSCSWTYHHTRITPDNGCWKITVSNGRIQHHEDDNCPSGSYLILGPNEQYDIYYKTWSQEKVSASEEPVDCKETCHETP